MDITTKSHAPRASKKSRIYGPDKNSRRVSINCLTDFEIFGFCLLKVASEMKYGRLN